MRTYPAYLRPNRIEIPQAIRVALVDDQALVRSGFRVMIETQSDMTVSWEAGDGMAALALLDDIPVDVVLMDVRLPGMDGIETTRRIIDAGYPASIIMLTAFDLDDYVYEALRAGASGFLLKDARATELMDAIRAVASGEAIIAPSTTKRLLAGLIPRPYPGLDDPRRALLTTRETDILIQIARGANNTEISRDLHLAMGTVKAHISRLLEKLQARDRVALVLIANQMGLGNIDSPIEPWFPEL